MHSGYSVAQVPRNNLNQQTCPVLKLKFKPRSRCCSAGLVRLDNLMTQRFINSHIAVCATGYRRYVEDFYSSVQSTSPATINMQVRYWVEAVEKFYSLDEDDYDQKVLEEGILVLNNLANSLLYLGGANWSGSGRVPSLLELFNGKAFNLKQDRPELFKKLEEINRLYNKLSKHFTLQRRVMFEEVTYKKLHDLLEASAKIWQWVCEQRPEWDEFCLLFSEPMEILRRGYAPNNEEV